MLSLIALAVTAFVATNLDNLCVLSACFANASARKWDVVTGQMIGAVVLIVGAASITALLLQVPTTCFRALGVLPFGIGLLGASRQMRRGGTIPSLTVGVPPAKALVSICTVAGMTVANGSDNLVVYVSLYAGRSVADYTVVGATMTVMAAAMCGIAHWLVSHGVIGYPLRRYGPMLLPWLLVVIGLIVMLQQSDGIRAISS